MSNSLIKVVIAISVVLSVAAVGAVPAAADDCDNDNAMFEDDCPDEDDGNQKYDPEEDSIDRGADTDDDIDLELSNEQKASAAEMTSAWDGASLTSGGGMYTRATSGKT